MPEREPFPELRTLRLNGIEFIVVGGVAAALHGVPGQTFDVDVVYSREPENIKRILKWLEQVDAIFRIQPARRLRPNESHLMGTGHLNLLTRFGPVDLLAQVGRNLGFADLLPHSTEMEIGDGLRVRVLSLEKIIEIREQLGTDKDKAALPLLRQTLRELKSRNHPPA